MMEFDDFVATVQIDELVPPYWDDEEMVFSLTEEDK